MRGVVLGDMDIAGITATAIARAALERRRLLIDGELGEHTLPCMKISRLMLLVIDSEAFDGFVNTTNTAIDLIREKGGDDTLKLEKFLVSTVSAAHRLLISYSIDAIASSSAHGIGSI